MTFMELITAECLVLIPVLWILGTFLKKSEVPDSTIPWLLLIVGVVLTNMTLGFSAHSIIQGVLITGAAVLGHQLVKQTDEFFRDRGV